MIKNDLDVLKNKIKSGALHRDIDEAYVDGVWDYAIEYVKKHHSSVNSTDMEKEMQIAVLYDFIYDLLEGDLK